jgi:hypothetical protein
VEYTENGSSIGFFITDNDGNETKELKAYLLNIGYKESEIFVLRYIPKKEEIVEQGECYTVKDIKWAGYPVSEKVNNFIRRKYAKFYYLCHQYESHQHYIMSKIKANFKAGVYYNGLEKILDLTIDNEIKNACKNYIEIEQIIHKLTLNNGKQI